MNEKQRIELANRLSSMPGNEVLRLKKRAQQIRKCAPGAKARRPLDDLDEEETFVPLKAKQSRNLDDILWELLRAEEDVPPPAGQSATVLSINMRSCRLWLDGSEVTALLPVEMAAEQQSAIAVGDEVMVERKSDQWIVCHVLPRRTALSRPDPHLANKERVVVANVDLVVVVASVISPPLRTRLLDRYWIAIQRGGAQMAVAVNKLDLCASASQRQAELDQLKPYERLGVPIIPCSASQSEGLDELRTLLRGKLSAFVGHSGVGKSSLLNCLKPSLGLDTGDVSEGYGRGTHTTTASTLWTLDENTRVIDTPGIRSFGLFKVAAEDLAWYFPEFSSFACRFRDCTHTGEPGCGVKVAAASGELSPERFDAYLRIRGSL